MNVKQLRKKMKPTERKGKTVYLVSYIEDADSTTITYSFKNQKESHLKVSKDTWEGMTFECTDDNKIIITGLNGISVKTNDNGWSRLVVTEEDDDE